jgi:D-alanyl-D-alanine carboxypeptidase/D-alanyl-D-alanine-endopeptidase (penicillin-binding protein 4)
LRRLVTAAALVTALAPRAAAQTESLADRIAKIAARPEFRHSLIGVKVVPLDRDTVLFGLNPDQLFVPGSTTKLLTAGTAIETLGSDYRFHTRVYRTGPIGPGGVVRGDLVLVASGDPNLSHRIRGDSLLFVDEDHSYGNDPTTDLIPGDPLAVLRELAAQVKAKGIRRITGSVRVDHSLFAGDGRELGTGVMLSSISVNDNIVDLVVKPGNGPGAPATVTVSPETAYLRIVNRIVTGPGDSEPTADIGPDTTAADGRHTVTLTGSYPAGKAGLLLTYKVAEPERLAAAGLIRALRDAGVAVGPNRLDRVSVSRSDRPEEMVVAEHVSPPFKEAVKVLLKVSQNLHASMMPYVLGALRGKNPTAQGGFDVEREFLTKAGLDLAGAVQSDGAGGAALYTPSFMVSYLKYMATRPTAADFRRGLPILGVDGTLAKISRGAPAAGHVFAKTGTFVSGDLLNRGLVVDGKGLAGYLTTRSGRELAFAIYLNRVKLGDPRQIQEVVGQAAGDIAAAIYDSVP